MIKFCNGSNKIIQDQNGWNMKNEKSCDKCCHQRGDPDYYDSWCCKDRRAQKRTVNPFFHIHDFESYAHFWQKDVGCPHFQQRRWWHEVQNNGPVLFYVAIVMVVVLIIKWFIK